MRACFTSVGSLEGFGGILGDLLRALFNADGAEELAREEGVLDFRPFAGAGDNRERLLAGDRRGEGDAHVFVSFGKGDEFVFVNFVGEMLAGGVFDVNLVAWDHVGHIL